MPYPWFAADAYSVRLTMFRSQFFLLGRQDAKKIPRNTVPWVLPSSFRHVPLDSVLLCVMFSPLEMIYSVMHSHGACVCALQPCLTLRPHGLWPARLLPPWGYPGQNTGMDCHALFQGNLPNPRIEPTSPALTGRFSTTEPPGES